MCNSTTFALRHMQISLSGILWHFRPPSRHLLLNTHDTNMEFLQLNGSLLDIFLFFSKTKIFHSHPCKQIPRNPRYICTNKSLETLYICTSKSLNPVLPVADDDGGRCRCALHAQFSQNAPCVLGRRDVVPYWIIAPRQTGKHTLRVGWLLACFTFGRVNRVGWLLACFMLRRVNRVGWLLACFTFRQVNKPWLAAGLLYVLQTCKHRALVGCWLALCSDR